jgi:hypothetical protein
VKITAGKIRFGAALAAALALHALLLTLPVKRPAPLGELGTIELELTAFLPEPEPTPKPTVEPVVPVAPPPESVESLAETAQPKPRPTPAEPEPRQPPARQARASTDVILSRQFITEEPVIDRLFGRPLEAPAPQVDFRIPQRTDMLTMLNRPMQDLPFEYTPGLVHFAYAPGVRGDLQRFWDVITPEFGWRTNNGTEVRCVLLLVVIGCGWK